MDAREMTFYGRPGLQLTQYSDSDHGTKRCFGGGTVLSFICSLSNIQSTLYF